MKTILYQILLMLVRNGLAAFIQSEIRIHAVHAGLSPHQDYYLIDFVFTPMEILM
jgi:hypothetical protein